MVRNLTLLRHGEAETGTGYLNDFSRKLTPTGISKLYQLSKLLEEKKVHYDLLIKSPAQRALQTAEIISNHLQVDQVTIDKKLYDNTVENLLDILENIPDQCENVLIVGHNPSLTTLLMYLTGDSPVSLIPGMMGVLSFDFPSWKMLSQGTANLREVLQ